MLAHFPSRAEVDPVPLRTILYRHPQNITLLSNLHVGHWIVCDNSAVKAMQLTGYLLPDSAKTEQPNDLVIQ